MTEDNNSAVARGIVRDVLYRNFPTEVHADTLRAVADEILEALAKSEAMVELRDVYTAWVKEEAEGIAVIEAVARYLHSIGEA